MMRRGGPSLVLGLLILAGCGSPRRPWREPKTGPPQPWEEDVTVTLDSGEKATFRVVYGRMKEVEPGLQHVVEPKRTRFRMSDLPCFGVEVAPLSGRHQLRCVYDHPPVVDENGKRRTRKEQPGIEPVGPATHAITHYNALDFSIVAERWRVPGNWTLSVYEGRTLIKAVTFTVTAD